MGFVVKHLQECKGNVLFEVRQGGQQFLVVGFNKLSGRGQNIPGRDAPSGSDSPIVRRGT